MQNAHPYIRVSDMGNRIIDKSKLLYVPDKTFTSISRYTVNDGDIILSIVGTIGLISQVTAELDNASLTENCVKITNLNGVLREYLYYFLISENCQNEIRSKTVGTTQPKLPLYNINSLQIKVPPLPTQRRIAEILSALDDKIELNRQTNATLEAIAQAIFKEWFVNFNFPGATGEMVESELGMIPKGWRVGKLGEICEFAYGKGLKSEIRVEGKYPVVGSNGIVGTHNDYLAEGPGIVIGRKGTIGEVTWVHQNFFPIDTTFYINDLLGVNDLYFHYFLLKEQDFKKIGSDSAVPGLNRNQAYVSLVVIPAKDVINQFNDITKAVFADIYNYSNESSTLATIRDSLLPKLMSGEIEV